MSEPLDINRAALKLTQLEIIKSQIQHLQDEARNADSVAYANTCNSNALELIKQLDKIVNE